MSKQLQRAMAIFLWCVAVSVTLTMLVAVAFFMGNHGNMLKPRRELAIFLPILVGALIFVTGLCYWCGHFALPPEEADGNANAGPEDAAAPEDDAAPEDAAAPEDDAAAAAKARVEIIKGMVNIGKIILDSTITVGLVAYRLHYPSYSTGKWHAYLISMGAAMTALLSSIFGLGLVKDPVEGLNVLSSAMVTSIIYCLGDGRNVLACLLVAINVYVAIGFFIGYLSSLLHQNSCAMVIIMWSIYVGLLGLGILVISWIPPSTVFNQQAPPPSQH